jgi:hypothetical protein
VRGLEVAPPALRVEVVEHLPRTAVGKRQLARRLPAGAHG